MIFFAKQNSSNHKILLASSKYQTYIFEIQNGNKTQRILTFENNPKPLSVQGAIYSKMPNRLSLKYYKMMLFSLTFIKNPKKVLVLGMGIGAIPKEIIQYYPDTKIDIIEINPKIPQIAIKYFNFQETQNTTIIIQDAYDFVMNLKSANYDLIFVDIFDNKYIPSQFLQDSFIKQLKKIIKSNGIIAFNTFTNSPNYKKEEELIVSNFDFAFELKENNRILFVSNQDLQTHQIPQDLAKKIDFQKYFKQLIKK